VAEESGFPPIVTEAAPAEVETDSAPVVTKPALVEDILEWPRCGFCGSLTLHESSRGGFHETWLRWGSAAVYRCDGCSRRFAFAPLGRHRGRAGRRREGAGSAPPVQDRMRSEDRRRRIMRVTWTLLAALLTFVLAAWMINRSEQRYLEGEVQVPQPQ
jgi:hypothetical protein